MGNVINVIFVKDMVKHYAFRYNYNVLFDKV